MTGSDPRTEGPGKVVPLRPRRRRLVQVLVDAGAWEAFVAAALTLGAGDVPGPIGELRSIETTSPGEPAAAARTDHLPRRK